MTPVNLPDGTPTSRIGFGCAGLISAGGLAAARALVSAAIESGIRHFDVAPVYGSGEAENALAACLTDIDEPVTIATKIGIVRPSAPGLQARLRQAARCVLSSAPALRRKLGQRVYSTSRKVSFAIPDIEASFSESLRRLRRERVDLLLLHEPAPEHLTDELLAWLERQRVSGRAGSVGIGAARATTDALTPWPDTLSALQTNWAAGDSPIAARPALLSTHGALRGIGEVAAALKADPQRRAAVQEATGLDPVDRGTLARLLLGAAGMHNQDGLLLVASSNPDNIRSLASADLPKIDPALLGR